MKHFAQPFESIKAIKIKKEKTYNKEIEGKKELLVILNKTEEHSRGL